jgi:predicted patatin/cPLA2 family phospholipase
MGVFNMTVVCAVCSKELSSFLLDEKSAIQDLLNIMITHLMSDHRTEHDIFAEDMKDAMQIVQAIPAFCLLDSFVDIESPKTSSSIKQAYEQMAKAMEQLGEIIAGTGEEESTVVESS